MSNNTPRELNKHKALELFIQGYTYREIAHNLNCAVSNAHALVNEALAEVREQNIEEVLDIRNTQLIALRKLIKQRFEDLKDCDDIISDDGRVYRNGVRERGYIVRDLLALYQEIGKIYGIYAPERIEQFISAKKEEENKALESNYAEMETEQLKILFADMIREQD